MTLESPLPESGVERREVPEFKMNLERAEEHLNDLEKYPISKRICICGHTEKSHIFDSSSGFSCQPGNVWCHCRRPIVVYFASDARCFSRATHGIGFKHALGIGIADLHRKKKSGEWLVPLRCWIPDCKGLEITVACLDRDGRVFNKSTESSVLLCHQHAMELGGSRLLS